MMQDRSSASGIKFSSKPSGRRSSVTAVNFATPPVRGGKTTQIGVAAQIAIMNKARQKIVATSSKAIQKLESGKTLEFSVGLLERMNPQKLEQMCRKYRLKRGKPEEMRQRLAELLLLEKTRSNTYLQNKANRIVDEINARVDDDLQDLDAQLTRAVGEEIDVYGMGDRLDTLEGVNTERQTVISELNEWHHQYQAILADELSKDADDPAIAGKDWDQMVNEKHTARDRIREIIEGLMAELMDKRQQLLALSELARLAEERQHELEAKLAAAQKKSDEYTAMHNQLTREAKHAEAAAQVARDAAAKARAENEEIRKIFQERAADWARLEAELRKQIEEMRLAFAAEIETLERQYAEELRNMQTAREAEMQALRDSMEAERARLQAEYEKQLAALVADLKQKGLQEVSALSSEMSEVEQRIAALEAQIAKLRSDLEDLEAALQIAETEATAAEAKREAALAEVADPDIRLFRQHYDKYQWWKANKLGRMFESNETQATPPSRLPPMPQTQPSFREDEAAKEAATKASAQYEMQPMPPPVPPRPPPSLKPIVPFPQRPEGAVGIPVPRSRPRAALTPAPVPPPAPPSATPPSTAPPNRPRTPKARGAAPVPARPKTPKMHKVPRVEQPHPASTPAPVPKQLPKSKLSSAPAPQPTPPPRPSRAEKAKEMPPPPPPPPPPKRPRGAKPEPPPRPKPVSETARRQKVIEQRNDDERKRGATPRARQENQDAARTHAYVTVDRTESKNLVAALPPHLAKLVAKSGGTIDSGVDYVGSERAKRIRINSMSSSAAREQETRREQARAKVKERYKKAVKLLVKQTAFEQAVSGISRKPVVSQLGSGRSPRWAKVQENLQTGLRVEDVVAAAARQHEVR